MRKSICLFLSTLILSSSVTSTALAGTIINQELNPLEITIDAETLREVYERYASVTDENEVVEMLMKDFSFTKTEARELLEINKQAYTGISTRASYIQGTLPSSAEMGQVVDLVYFIDFKEMKDFVSITKFLAKQAGAGGAGVAVAATIAQIVFASFQKGGINWAKVTVSYTYGYTNDGVLGWTPGYTKYEYGA